MFRCWIFRLPNFLLPIFPVAVFSVVFSLFQTIILCCPFFLPSQFSLPNFSVAVISHINFALPCFPHFSLLIFPIAQFSGCHFFHCPVFLPSCFSLLIFPIAQLFSGCRFFSCPFFRCRESFNHLHSCTTVVRHVTHILYNTTTSWRPGSWRMPPLGTHAHMHAGSYVCTDRSNDWLTWVVVLRPTPHKIGHFGDVPPRQSLGLVWKKN